MAIHLFLKLLILSYDSIKPIEKMSRRHLISSSDVFVFKGFTVYPLCLGTNEGYIYPCV